MNKLAILLIFALVPLAIPMQQAEAHHCSALDLKACIDNLVHDVEKIAKDVEKIPGDISRIEQTIVTDVTGEIHVVGNEVKAVSDKVEKIEKAVSGEIITVITDIEKDVDSVEKAIVGDITKDIGIIKEDIAKIERLVVAVERIEKKVVDTTEDVIKAIIGDVKTDFVYIIYGLLALGASYVIIRIIQFAIWLKAYLRDDGIEYYAKAQVAQNKEIISLLVKLLDK